MDVISSESKKILEYLSTVDAVPEDNLPSGYEWALLPFLVSKYWVKKFSVLQPNMEPDYPHGLWAYAIDSAGKEVLQAANDQAKHEAKQNAKDHRRYIWRRIEFFVGLFIGWLLGGFTPKEAFAWIEDLFPKFTAFFH